jgi:YVTN family beta-propeller protein
VEPATCTVYVTNEVDGTVSVIDGATGKVTHTIHERDAPRAVAVDHADRAIYVANWLSDTVSVINESTNTVTRTIT